MQVGDWACLTDSAKFAVIHFEYELHLSVRIF